MMKHKIFYSIIIIVSLLIGLTLYYNATLYTTITIGIFSGSNWNVPNPNSYTIIDNAIERFEKENPYIRIKYQSGVTKDDYSSWLSSLILKGDEPDLYMILSDDFNTLSSLNALENLETWIEKDNSFSKNDYYNSSLSAGVFNDIQYALPYESNPTLMFVNETLLEKEGISIPDNDWTIDDFYDICQKVTKDTNNDGTIDQYGFYNYSWQNVVNAYGIELFNEDGTNCYFNSKDIKEALLYMKKLNALNSNLNVTSQDFDKGNVAFYPLSFSDYRTYKPYPYRVQKYSTFKWKCIPMPTVTNKQSISETSTLLIGMSSRSTHKQTAWEFLKYLSYDKQAQTDLFEYSQGISVLKKVTQSQDIISLIEEDSLDNTINIESLNKVMELNTSTSKFKKKDNTLLRADYLINQALSSNDDIETSLNEIQKDIRVYLNE
jgi:multiple sugar transport system substrate-binding protein